MKTEPMTIERLEELLNGIWKGSNFWVICPFHDDTNESLKIFPTPEQASYCWSCARFAWWDEIVAEVKNISIDQAKELLGDTRTIDRTKEEKHRVIYHSFCDEYPEYDLSYQYSLTLPLPDEAREWLDKKGILTQALQAGWRWTNNSIKGWYTGIVIPYFEDREVAYMRYRMRTGYGKYNKPIGPRGISPRPYYSWDTYADTVYICEGESDTLTLARRGVSVIGIPGASQMTCINTAVAEAANRRAQHIIAVGDNDEAGRAFVNRIKKSTLYLSSMDALELPVPVEYNDVNDYHSAGGTIRLRLSVPPKKHSETPIESSVRIFGPGTTVARDEQHNADELFNTVNSSKP